MPLIRVDGKLVRAAEGDTLLAALRGKGIFIPTLCHHPGFRSWSSCMVCVVKDAASGRFQPSCSTPAMEGMEVEAETDEVRQARKDALELLLADHLGDCAAPCQRACPAHMDIPAMIRMIAAGKALKAAAVARRHIALPATLGWVCPAPCEKACRRGRWDEPVSICLLKRYAGESGLAAAGNLPSPAACSGKKVAVVGAGPAGLAAAFHLSLLGHACTVFEREDAAGGMLRRLPPGRLPAAVLDGEAEQIRRLGARFEHGRKLGRDLDLSVLRENFDAVVLSMGETTSDQAKGFGLAATPHGIRVDPYTLATSESGVFAGGNAVHPGRLAVRAVAHGRRLASSVDRFFGREGLAEETRGFVSAHEMLRREELAELASGADPSTRAEAPGGFSKTVAAAEARRCLRCDCRKRGNCSLQSLAMILGARQARYRGGMRKTFHLVREHPAILYEPGKCVKCGLCLQVTEKAGERLGLAFIGRGFDVRVGVPFGETLEAGLTRSAQECAAVCPTGALSLAREGES